MGIDEEDKDLWGEFCPEILKEGTEWNKRLKELKELLGDQRISDDYELYNIIEKTILDLDLEQKEKDRLNKEHMKIELILQKNKWLAMQLFMIYPSIVSLYLFENFHIY